jgi:di/tricarboxylate transporter
MLQAAAANKDPVFQHALRPISFFEITPLGIACVLAGTSYMLLVSGKLLPDHQDLLEQLGASSREYLVDMLVQPGCRLVEQTIEQAGLRRLPGLFLVEITRGNEIISPVGPEEKLQVGDRLSFTGIVDSIVDLERIPGLVAAADGNYEIDATRKRGRRLCEAVISPASPLIGNTLRGADFRALYNAAVVAVHRGGSRLTGRLGDIVLRPGDTLLLQTGSHFARAHHNNPDFILVSGVEESRPIRHDRAPVCLALLGLLVILMVSGVVDIVVSAFLVAALMIGTHCISTSDARESINWQTLISIAASFGLGKAMENSGAAQSLADMVVKATGQWGPAAVLAAIYFVTMIFAGLIAHNAAAALMFPFALAVAAEIGVSPRPFAIAIMFGASLSFATPMGYQTNLMVYGPGRYRVTDYTRIGLPLNIILWILASLLIPVLWPFR